MSEATAGRRQAGSAVGQPTGPRATGPTLDRRRVLRLALALPAAAALVSGCSGVTARRKEPDPLVALADAARADAALAAAAIAADPGLSARIEPLRAARAEHAAALDAEVVRVGGVPGAAAPTSVGPTAAPAAPPSGSAQARPRPEPLPRHRSRHGSSLSPRCGTPSRRRSAVPRIWCRVCRPSASVSSRPSPPAVRPTRRCSHERRQRPSRRRGGRLAAGRPGHRARGAVELRPRDRVPEAGAGRPRPAPTPRRTASCGARSRPR